MAFRLLKGGLNFTSNLGFGSSLLTSLQRIPHSVTRTAPLHQSRPLCGLEELFENGEALPPFDPASRKVYGRAWSADELRLKSFEDLHKLWFVVLKELNLLATQEAEARRMGQRWFGVPRVHKCRTAMARIKTVLTERQKLHETAAALVRAAEMPPPTEGELLVAQQRRDKLCQLWRKRKFRQRMNYRTRRESLFV